jgi:RHS repeat-associated protein
MESHVSSHSKAGTGSSYIGGMIEQHGTRQTPYGFTGEIEDENGLLYLRARYLSSQFGNFLSLDPLEGMVDRPMSLNGYSYVEGNPVNWTDACGTSPLDSLVCGLPLLLPPADFGALPCCPDWVYMLPVWLREALLIRCKDCSSSSNPIPDYLVNPGGMTLIPVPEEGNRGFGQFSGDYVPPCQHPGVAWVQFGAGTGRYTVTFDVTLQDGSYQNISRSWICPDNFCLVTAWFPIDFPHAPSGWEDVSAVSVENLTILQFVGGGCVHLN